VDAYLSRSSSVTTDRARTRSRRAETQCALRRASRRRGTSGRAAATSPATPLNYRSPPWLAGSTGNSFAGRISTPVKSWDRVVVFRVAQPARQHEAGIIGMAPCVLRADRLNPVDDRLTLDRRRLLSGLARRHFTRLETRDHEIPAVLISHHGVRRRIRRQIEAGRRLTPAVASVAIRLQNGLDARLERVRTLSPRRPPFGYQ
jgi:hypothetical protein